MSDWISLVDVNGCIRNSNKAGVEFLGKTARQIIGKECFKLPGALREALSNIPLYECKNLVKKKHPK